MQVILSVRDPDKWYDSYVASLLWLYQTWWFKPFSWCLPMGWKLQVGPLALKSALPASCTFCAILEALAGITCCGLFKGIGRPMSIAIRGRPSAFTCQTQWKNGTDSI